MTQRTFSVFGDSISTFEGVTSSQNRVYYAGDLCRETGVLSPEDTWWGRVVSHFGGRLVSNAAFSGSTVDGAAFPAGRSSERIAEIAGPGGETPDDILVFIGINDYGWGGAWAQAAARSAAMPQCPETLAIPEGEAGPATAESLPSFARAYDTMLAAMRAAYPAARIWCLTLLPGRERSSAHPTFAYRLRGIDLDDYNDVIREAAAANGCLVADVRAAGFDYEASDGTHPTDRGMAQLAALVVAAMEAGAEVAEAQGARSADAADDLRRGDGRKVAARVEGALAGASAGAGAEAGAPDAQDADAADGLRRGGGGSSATFDPFGVRDTGLNGSREAFAGLSAELFPEEMRSARRCDRATCFGCEHARGTGNEWSCVCEMP